jgi:hypothetical protein
MKRRFGPSLYFANDKVIFDSLNQRQVSIDLIRELLNERGILVSAYTPKEELAQYFSRLTADFFDHKSIATKLGTVARRERMTYSEIKEVVQRTDIIATLNSLKRAWEDEGSAVRLEVVDDRVVALISYEHIDYTKSEFRQVEPRDALIEFTKEPSGNYVVRSTQNTFTDAAVEQVFTSLGNSLGKPVERARISLEGNADPKSRTQFFESLIKGIGGFSFVTVSEAYCYKPKLASAIKSGDDDKELEDLPYVERVALRGHGVNRSLLIDDLYKNDYYIVKVTWRVRLATQIDSDEFELEAQFSKPDSCTDFSYQVKSVVIRENGRVTDKKRGPKKDEQDTFLRLIEQSAKKAYSSL